MLLDNLKLGYGGTQEEMKRLLSDAEKISGIKYDISSYADIVDAIHVIQTEMGITGTTALEAGRTISGSVGAMKSAWTNLVTGFADGNADIEGLIDNLVTTIVGDGTESNLGVIGNVLPAVERALSGTGKLIEGAIPVLIERLPGLLQQILPVLLSSATSLVNSVIEVLPELVDLIVDTLIDNAPMLIVAATEMILALAVGLVEAIPKIILAIPTIIQETVDALGSSENIKKFLEVGKNIVVGIWEGLKGAWGDLKKWFADVWDDLVGGVKDFLGIHSPSRVFAGIGKNMALGVGEGWDDEFGDIQDDIDNSLAFDDPSMRINASVRKMGAGAAGMSYGGTSFGDVYINIDGTNYDDPHSLAVAVAEELQNMTDRRLAVYA
jgi:phage-related protein